MPIKSVKMKISKNKKMCFFLMSQGSLNPKIRFLGQKMWPVARSQTHRRTDTQSDYWGHPFRISGFQDFFLQPIIKDRPNTLVLWHSHHITFWACIAVLHDVKNEHLNITLFISIIQVNNYSDPGCHLTDNEHSQGLCTMSFHLIITMNNLVGG